MQESTLELLKGAPPASVAAAIYVAGLSVEQWVGVLTVVWLVIIICQHAWDKWLRPFLRKRRHTYDEHEDGGP
jgi:hypothetical protein